MKRKLSAIHRSRNICGFNLYRNAFEGAFIQFIHQTFANFMSLRIPNKKNGVITLDVEIKQIVEKVKILQHSPMLHTVYILKLLVNYDFI